MWLYVNKKLLANERTNERTNERINRQLMTKIKRVVEFLFKNCPLLPNVIIGNVRCTSCAQVNGCTSVTSLRRIPSILWSCIVYITRGDIFRVNRVILEFYFAARAATLYIIYDVILRYWFNHRGVNNEWFFDRPTFQLTGNIMVMQTNNTPCAWTKCAVETLVALYSNVLFFWLRYGYRRGRWTTRTNTFYALAIRRLLYPNTYPAQNEFTEFNVRQIGRT